MAGRPINCSISGFACSVVTQPGALNWAECISEAFTGVVTITHCASVQSTVTITAQKAPTTALPVTSTFVEGTKTWESVTSVRTVMGEYPLINAQMIPLYWKASDRPPSSTITSHHKMPSTTNSTVSPTSNSTVSPTSSHSSHPDKIVSTGVKATASVVPTAVVVLAIALLGVYFYRKRKRSSRMEAVTEYHKPELDGSAAANNIEHDRRAMEPSLEGMTHEVEGQPARSELAAPIYVHELQGSGV